MLSFLCLGVKILEWKDKSGVVVRRVHYHETPMPGEGLQLKMWNHLAEGWEYTATTTDGLLRVYQRNKLASPAHTPDVAGATEINERAITPLPDWNDPFEWRQAFTD